MSHSNILGIGIDIVEISRIDHAIQRWGDRFLCRVFSGQEIDYCGRKPISAQHYAARFAAKEACLKCLGIGLGSGVALKDIRVVNVPSGKPELIIDTDLRPVLKNAKLYQFHLSMAHSREYASAIVVAELITHDLPES